MHYVIRNLTNSDKAKYFGYYCSLIHLHSTCCENASCPSHELYETLSTVSEEFCQLKNEEGLGGKGKADKLKLFIALFTNKRDIPENLKTFWRSKIPQIGKMLGAILQELKAQHPESDGLAFLKVYFDYYYSGHILGALEGMKEIEKMKSGAQQELEIFMLVRKIEFHMSEANSHAGIFCNEYVDNFQALNFHMAYAEFLDTIDESVKNATDFWSVLKKQDLCIMQSIFNKNSSRRNNDILKKAA